MGYEISLRRQEAEMIEIISEEEARNTNSATSLYDPISENIPVTEKQMKALAQGKRRTINVALVGNPNCGKTSLFNIASGAHEHVGNYSGVTVDAKEGFFDFQGYHFRLVDLPGTYSLFGLQSGRAIRQKTYHRRNSGRDNQRGGLRKHRA